VKAHSESQVWSFPTAAMGITDFSLGTQMTSGDFENTLGHWTPDGLDFFFGSNRRGSQNIYRRGSSSESPVRLTTAAGQQNDASLSADGRWVVLTVNMPGTSQTTFQTHLMRPDGTELHPLFGADASAYRFTCCAHWARTGATLALTLGLAGRETIGIAQIDPNDGHVVSLRKLELPEQAHSYAAWSPDGRFISYEARGSNSFDIWVTDVAGRTPRRITSFPEAERGTSWQASPLMLYFRRGFNEIWRVPMGPDGAATGPPALWLKIAGYEFEHGLDVSPKGDQILLTPVRVAADILLVELGPGR
jgi:Tol biopolymer transport system component